MITMEDFDFFKTCNKCQDEECCKEPYYAFVAANEIERIRKKKDTLNLKILENCDDFFDFVEIEYENDLLKFRIIKKINKKCVFLKGKRSCLIHDVKPFDCKIWPLTYDYFPKENELVVYLGECPLTTKVTKSWIESTIKEIQKELKKRTLEELIAYSLLDRDDTLKIIKKIPNFL